MDPDRRRFFLGQTLQARTDATFTTVWPPNEKELKPQSPPPVPTAKQALTNEEQSKLAREYYLKINDGVSSMAGRGKERRVCRKKVEAELG